MPHRHPTPPQCQPRRPGPPPPPERQNSQSKAKFPHRESGPLAAPHVVDKTNPNSRNPYAITHLRSEPGRFAQRSNKIVATLLEGNREHIRSSPAQLNSLSPFPRNNLRLPCHPDSACPCSTGADRPTYGFRTLEPPPPTEKQNSPNKAKFPRGESAPQPVQQLADETNPISHKPLCHHPLTRAPTPRPLSPPRFTTPARQLLCDEIGQRSLSARGAVSEYGN
jgi:hypothetical protein